MVLLLRIQLLIMEKGSTGFLYFAISVSEIYSPVSLLINVIFVSCTMIFEPFAILCNTFEILKKLLFNPKVAFVTLIYLVVYQFLLVRLSSEKSFCNGRQHKFHCPITSSGNGIIFPVAFSTGIWASLDFKASPKIPANFFITG